jgi:hypothetical protein
MLTYADYTGPGFTVFPMNHADVVRRMCSMPWEFQRSGALQETVIRLMWPELMDVPFHRDAGMRRAFAVQKAWHRAQRGARRLAADAALRL